jgi:hypothetical protein
MANTSAEMSTLLGFGARSSREQGASGGQYHATCHGILHKVAAGQFTARDGLLSHFKFKFKFSHVSLHCMCVLDDRSSLVAVYEPL